MKSERPHETLPLAGLLWFALLGAAVGLLVWLEPQPGFVEALTASAPGAIASVAKACA